MASPFSVINAVELGQTVEEGRLAAACRPYDAEKLALLDIEGDIIQHQEIPEAFRQMLHTDFDLFRHIASSLLTGSCPSLR